MSQQKDCITVIFRNTETSNDCAKSSSATQWSFCSIALAYNMIGIQDSNYLYWRKGGFIRVSSRDNLDKNDENFVNKSKSYLKSRAHDQIIGRMIIRFIFFLHANLTLNLMSLLSPRKFPYDRIKIRKRCHVL